MIHIDTREGVSSDMMLAALIEILPEHMADDVVSKMTRAAATFDMRFYAQEVDEADGRGLAISYVSKQRPRESVSHRDAFSDLSTMNLDLGSTGDVARRILDRVFEAESQAHSLPPEEVHLHEVGRPEALLNIAGIGLVAPIAFGPGEDVSYSTVTTGRGITVTSHGTMRIPAPAAAFLLRGLVHTPGDHPGERATPTGVAALSVLAARHSDDPPQDPSAKGVGYGTKRFAGRLGRVVVTRS